jgi:hypothetical protein
MRADGHLIFGRHMVDFGSHAEAVRAVDAEFRRTGGDYVFEGGLQ